MAGQTATVISNIANEAFLLHISTYLQQGTSSVEGIHINMNDLSVLSHFLFFFYWYKQSAEFFAVIIILFQVPE